MKILLINPNTSQFVTDTVTAQARRIASPGTEIVGVTGRMGAPIIGTRAENTIGSYMTLELAAEHGADCDAIVLAVSFDSGLQAVRELLTIPVVGMSEAAMLSACMLGRTFSMVTFGQRTVPLYEELVSQYRLDARFAGMVAIAPLTEAEQRDPATIVPRLVEEIERAVDTLGAESVVLGGAIFAGLSPEVMARSPVPIIDGITAAVGMAELLVRMGPKKPSAGSYQLPTAKPLHGVSQALETLYAGLPQP